MSPTEEIHILIVFSCDTGAVEQLAMAAAVGAVQARASIRLRRMVDSAKPANLSTDRMDQDYVAPREADVVWADGFVVAVDEYFLPQIQSLGGLDGKPVEFLTKAEIQHPRELTEKGILSDRYTGRVDRDGARLLGRRVAETALARRVSSQ